MGLSASQARFLQLTARRSDIEYEAQQINFQRLQLSQKQEAASMEYQDKMSNRKLMFQYNKGDGIQKVELSYSNYKNYMNQQGVQHSQVEYYLTSSSGNKIIVPSEKERDEFIEKNTTRIPLQDILNAKEKYDSAEDKSTLSELEIKYANIDLTNYESEIIENEDGTTTENYINRKFNENDFIIDETILEPDAFQMAIKNGTYFFSQYVENSITMEMELRTQDWETLGAGAIVDALGESDDAQAQAEFDKIQSQTQSIDKKLELKLDQLETNRQAITTELESVKKVIDEDIEKSFNIFS